MKLFKNYFLLVLLGLSFSANSFAVETFAVGNGKANFGPKTFYSLDTLMRYAIQEYFFLSLDLHTQAHKDADRDIESQKKDKEEKALEEFADSGEECRQGEVPKVVWEEKATTRYDSGRMRFLLGDNDRRYCIFTLNRKGFKLCVKETMNEMKEFMEEHGRDQISLIAYWDVNKVLKGEVKCVETTD